MFKLITQNIIALLLVIAVVVAVNYLSSQYSGRWDLTDEKEYTLAPSSIKILDRLEDRLTIKLYYSKELPDLMLPIKQQISDLIHEYKAHSKEEIVIEFVEPDLNETTEKEAVNLGIAPLELNVIKKDKQIVVKAYMGMAIYYQDKKQVIPVVAQIKNLEYMMDLSLLKLTQKKLPVVGVYLGANQSKYKLIDQVVKQMATFKLVGPSTKNWDELGLTALIVLDPMSVTVEQLSAWDDLVKNGLSLLLFSGSVDVSGEMKPEFVVRGIDDWLAKKGVSVSSELLLDIKQNAQARFQTGFMQVYLDYPFWVRALSSEMSKKNIITSGLEDVVFPWTNVIQMYPEKDSPWEYSTLIQSSDKSFLQKEELPEVGPQYVQNMAQMPVFKRYPLSVMLTQDFNGKTGRIFVTATHHILQDNFLQQYQGNVLFISNMIEYATWGDFLIGVRSRGKTSRPLLDLSTSDKSRIRWVVTVMTPMACVFLGLLWLWTVKRRRHRLAVELLG